MPSIGIIVLLLLLLFATHRPHANGADRAAADRAHRRAARQVPRDASPRVSTSSCRSSTRSRANIDLREQVVSFPPQPVITSDNLVVNIDTVIYYSVIDAKSAVYEIANFIQGIEQLTVTTLRNVIGSLDLEQTLTSRDQINAQLRGVLDEATGKWGIRVNRVELKAIDPPMSVQESMEKQMKAERERRAQILYAEGTKQSADPHRRGREAEPDPPRRGFGPGSRPRGAGSGPGHPAGVRGDPPRQADPEAAGLPVPPGAPADRPRRLQQDVDHPERAHRRPQGHRRDARPKPPAAASTEARTRTGSTTTRRWRTSSRTRPSRTRPRPWPRPAARPAGPARRPREHANPVGPGPAAHPAVRRTPCPTRDAADAPAPPAGPPAAPRGTAGPAPSRPAAGAPDVPRAAGGRRQG